MRWTASFVDPLASLRQVNQTTACAGYVITQLV
jgi:hypothetical protein